MNIAIFLQHPEIFPLPLIICCWTMVATLLVAATSQTVNNMAYTSTGEQTSTVVGIAGRKSCRKTTKLTSDDTNNNAISINAAGRQQQHGDDNGMKWQQHEDNNSMKTWHRTNDNKQANTIGSNHAAMVIQYDDACIFTAVVIRCWCAIRVIYMNIMLYDNCRMIV